MAKTLTNQQKKDLAKLLYLNQGLTQQEIADKVGVSRVTVGRWATDGNWEMLRAAVTSTREEQVRNLYQQIAQINRAIADSETKCATPAQADTILKLSAAISKMEGDFLAAVRDIKAECPAFDLVMFPVDPRTGGDFARGARQWLQAIPTRRFAPMHFPPAREQAMAFGPEAEQLGTEFLYIHTGGEQIAHF